ncbi:hypothetical protein CASFOL_040899 [Castilleja foliolosa]|uniref:Gnk2-homologous domain-containing protein n=1 Tax=Castilleja foliolosa TaxID=1961234 RepID=A0ABD3BCY0_9LAMI
MSCNNNNLLIPSLIISINLITIYLLNIPPIAFSSLQDDTLIGYSCLSSTPPTNTFTGNLESVINDLMITNNYTSLHGGYWRFAVHKSDDVIDDSAFGHALCRGDLSTDECNTCVQKAAKSVVTVTTLDQEPFGSRIVWSNTRTLIS